MEAGNIIELICLITAFIGLRKDRNFAWRSFIAYMFITVVVEMVGAIIKRSHYHNNQWVYNIYIFFEAGFVSLMFQNLLGKYINSKPLILCGLAVIMLMYIYDIFAHGFFVYNDRTETVMSVFFVFYSFYYYFLLLKDERYIDLKRSASFWWVAGTLLFYFGGIAENLFFTYLRHINLGNRNITHYISLTLCTLLYGCWSYSFLCRKWQITSGN